MDTTYTACLSVAVAKSAARNASKRHRWAAVWNSPDGPVYAKGPGADTEKLGKPGWDFVTKYTDGMEF